MSYWKGRDRDPVARSRNMRSLNTRSRPRGASAPVLTGVLLIVMALVDGGLAPPLGATPTPEVGAQSCPTGSGCE